MTVKELIELLKNCSPDKVVHIGESSGLAGEVTKVIEDTFIVELR